MDCGAPEHIGRTRPIANKAPSRQVSGLKGLFDVNREARLVQPSDSYKVSVSILGRHPSLKHHPARARHREPIAIPAGSVASPVRGPCERWSWTKS
jgi:hypothetical protein